MVQDVTLLMRSPSSVSSLKLTRKASGAHTCRRLPSILGTCSQHQQTWAEFQHLLCYEHAAEALALPPPCCRQLLHALTVSRCSIVA